MPTVIYITDLSFDDYYDQIMHSINQRFHNYQTNFPEYPTSEYEYGELQSLSAYASHAADGLNANGVDLERIVV
jgi:hypothetical protein